jgi:hypothetical protein
VAAAVASDVLSSWDHCPNKRDSTLSLSPKCFTLILVDGDLVRRWPFVTAEHHRRALARRALNNKLNILSHRWPNKYLIVARLALISPDLRR